MSVNVKTDVFEIDVYESEEIELGVIHAADKESRKKKLDNDRRRRNQELLDDFYMDYFE